MRSTRLSSANVPYHAKQGFTLVETLVAILVLSFIIMAVTALMTRTMRATTVSQDREIATRLAHEGIELIKAKRNRNKVDGSLPFNANIVGTWRPDSTQLNALQAGAQFFRDTEVDSLLCLRTSPADSIGKYAHNCPADESVPLPGNFRRTVEVRNVSNPSGVVHSVVVIATVEWSGGDLQVGTILYDVM